MTAPDFTLSKTLDLLFQSMEERIRCGYFHGIRCKCWMLAPATLEVLKRKLRRRLREHKRRPLP